MICYNYLMPEELFILSPHALQVWGGFNYMSKKLGIYKKCVFCYQTFYVQKCRLKVNARFCSQQCYWKWMKGKPNKSLTKFKKGNPKPKNAYVFPKGAKHPNWKDGKKINLAGYILIRKLNHPFADCDGYIRENRLIAEKCLRRYLTKQEVIHHINGKKDDNRPDNLYLFSSNSAHISFHHKKNKLKSNL